MNTVEQAIFTSAVTNRSAGYQIVAHSPGLHDEDLKELAVWCPSHDSLLDDDPNASSVNFHPLPSGSFCVSQTFAAGWEYSGRGGARVYTHCLIASPEALARFSNNPFALLTAAKAAGAIEVRDPLPAALEPLTLIGGASPVDQNLLIRAKRQPGPKAVAVLIQTALDGICLAISGEPSSAELIAVLLNCLPVSCRTEFSFSTGLKFSMRRPFRINALSGDVAERRWVANHNNVSVLNLADGYELASPPLSGWAQWVERALSSDRTAFLASQLSKRRNELTMEDLPIWGLQLLEELESENVRQTSADVANFIDGAAAEIDAPYSEKNASNMTELPKSTSSDMQSFVQLAHAAHQQYAKTQEAIANAQTRITAMPAPSQTLDYNSPEVLEKLERLDDLVYEAISGQPGVMEQLAVAWPALKEELGETLLAESREQYLRYALSIWEGCIGKDNIRDPLLATQALEVLCLLFDDAG